MEDAAWRRQLTQIVETIASGVLVVNPDGRIVFANPEAARIFGVTQAALVGRRFDAPRLNVTTLDGQPFPVEERAFSRAMRTGKPALNVECAIERPNGTRIIVSVNAAPLRAGDGSITAVVASLTDITEPMQAQRQYRAILEIAMDGFLLVDAATGRILDANDAYCRLVGYSREEMLKMNVRDIEAAPPEQLAGDLQRVVKAGRRRFETCLRRKDGRPLDVECSVHYIKVDGGRFFSFARDLTERKRAEETMRQGERARFEAVANIIPEAIVSIDSNSRVVFFNKAAERIFGYAADEVVGKDVTMLMPERYRERHKHAMARYLATGKSTRIGRTLKLEALRRDGTEFPIELAIGTWRSPGGAFFVGVIRDVSERQAGRAA